MPNLARRDRRYIYILEQKPGRNQKEEKGANVCKIAARKNFKKKGKTKKEKKRETKGRAEGNCEFHK